MIKKTILLMIFSVFLTSCVPYKQLEELGIINTRGVDRIENNQLETTIIAYQFDAQTPEISTTLSGVGNTIKGAREVAGYNTNFELTPGQIVLELYGKETAETGILQFLSTLVRDARVSDTMLVAVSNVTAKEILTVGQVDLTTDVGRLIQNLIEKEVKEHSIPETSLQNFLHIESDVGQDPVTPVIGLKDDKPAIVGIAAFQNDKYVHQLTIDQAFLINVFLTTTKSTPLEITLPLGPFSEYIQDNTNDKQQDDTTENGDFFSILANIVRGKSDVKLTDKENLHFKADIQMEVDLYETTELISIKNEKIADLFEKEIAKEFERQYETLFSQLQEINSDPFGLGRIYRVNKKDGKLTDEEWREKFPNVTVDFNVNVDLMHYGTIQ